MPAALADGRFATSGGGRAHRTARRHLSAEGPGIRVAISLLCPHIPERAPRRLAALNRRIPRCATPMKCWGLGGTRTRRRSRAPFASSRRNCIPTPTRTTPNSRSASPRSTPPTRSWVRTPSARLSTAARSMPRASQGLAASRVSRARAAAAAAAPAAPGGRAPTSATRRSPSAPGPFASRAGGAAALTISRRSSTACSAAWRAERAARGAGISAAASSPSTSNPQEAMSRLR